MSTITSFPGYGEDAPLQLTDVQANTAATGFNPAHWNNWAEAAARVGHCSNPIRLRGTSSRVDTKTGEVLETYSTESEPFGQLYTRCGNRRASECPSCARLYARDTFELIRSGVIGGKTVPEQIADNPLVFATLTAPSFGQVHNATCGPKKTRKSRCRHGKPTGCDQVHNTENPVIGTPLCHRCYDYDTHIVWQWWAPELWRRFTIALRRALASRLGVSASRLGEVATVQYAKVAEFQARGAIHFHALIRVDGPKNAGQFATAPTQINVHELTQIVKDTISSVSFTAPPVTGNDRPRILRFGTQTDVRPVNSRQRNDDPQDGLTGAQVAGYLAKYATKSASESMPRGTKHHAQLQTTCEQLARAGFATERLDSPYLLLRKWAHMVGFRGHFSTKSRAYSVTLGVLRRARARFQRLVADSHRHNVPLDVRDLETRLLQDNAEEDTTLVIGSFTYAGQGWHNATETALALAAATRAQEYATWKVQPKTPI